MLCYFYLDREKIRRKLGTYITLKYYLFSSFLLFRSFAVSYVLNGVFVYLIHLTGLRSDICIIYFIVYVFTIVGK